MRSIHIYLILAMSLLIPTAGPSGQAKDFGWGVKIDFDSFRNRDRSRDHYTEPRQGQSGQKTRTSQDIRVNESPLSKARNEGFSAERAGNEKRAEAAYREALGVAPNDEWTKQALARVLWNKAVDLSGREQWILCRDALREALELTPGDNELREWLGNVEKLMRALEDEERERDRQRQVAAAGEAMHRQIDTLTFHKGSQGSPPVDVLKGPLDWGTRPPDDDFIKKVRDAQRRINEERAHEFDDVRQQQRVINEAAARKMEILDKRAQDANKALMNRTLASAADAPAEELIPEDDDLMDYMRQELILDFRFMLDPSIPPTLRNDPGNRVAYEEAVAKAMDHQNRMTRAANERAVNDMQKMMKLFRDAGIIEEDENLVEKERDDPAFKWILDDFTSSIRRRQDAAEQAARAESVLMLERELKKLMDK